MRSKTIDLHSKVTLQEGDEIMHFKIVESHEVKSLGDTISKSSPVGKALIGKCSNDTVSVNLFNGVTEFKILNVE